MENLKIALKGSCLDSIIYKGKEVLNTTSIWSKKSPILFPAISKDKSFTVNDVVYPIPRHGYWNDIDFDIKQHDEGFVLNGKVEHKSYPFNFEIEQYVLSKGNKVTLMTNVTGPNVPVQFGYHPAFMWDTGEMHFKGKAILANKDGSTGEIDVDFNNFEDLPWDTVDTFIFETNELKLINKEYSVLVNTNMKYIALWYIGDKFVCIEPWSNLPAVITPDDNNTDDDRSFVMDIIIESKEK